MGVHEDGSRQGMIERGGGGLKIVPAREDLRQVVKTLREMRKPSEVEVRVAIEMPDRD